MEMQRIQNRQVGQLKKNKVGDLTLPDLKTSYKAKADMSMSCWEKNRKRDPYVSIILIFNTYKGKSVEKEQSFEQMVLEKLDVRVQNQMNHERYLISLMEIN